MIMIAPLCIAFIICWRHIGNILVLTVELKMIN